VYLDEVEVDESDLVGVEGNGFMQAMINFEVERLLMASSLLGMAECAFNDAADYAASRTQFGKPIGSFQLIQQKITSMTLKIENMRNLVARTAWKIDNGMPVQIDSALAKLYCAQSANEVIDDALQIFGGIGYTTDCRVSRLWVDARVQRIGGGTDEVMIHIAGRQILKEHTK
ncbi:MAG: acyl-CoA dehydrogenase, partial [Actinobacteria bacterium]|nr:acyl-CoA dehydrogenase [Actinomycetota bacterium]